MALMRASQRLWRHSIHKQRNGVGPEGTPLLDAPSLEYLFAQVRSAAILYTMHGYKANHNKIALLQ